MADIQPKPTDVFVSPLSDFHPADIDANLKDLDKWLVEISGGVLTLDRLETIARNTPVLANLFSAVDLISDIRAMIDHGNRPIDLFDWLNLGLDLIGIIPIPLEASSKTPERGCLLPRQAVNLGHQNNGSPRMEAPIIDDELWIEVASLVRTVF